MACKCGSKRIIQVNGKTDDRFSASYRSTPVRYYDGYVPYNLHLGGGDYLSIKFCADCGVIQNFKPIPDETITEVFGAGSKD